MASLCNKDDELVDFFEKSNIKYSVVETEEEFDSNFFPKYTSFNDSYQNPEPLICRTEGNTVAIEIIKNRRMYGKNTPSCAHLALPYNLINIPNKTGLLLIFKWSGEQKMVPFTTNNNTEPDILYHVSRDEEHPSEKFNPENFVCKESKLYPGTNHGLLLYAICKGINKKKYILEEDVVIKIIPNPAS